MTRLLVFVLALLIVAILGFVILSPSNGSETQGEASSDDAAVEVTDVDGTDVESTIPVRTAVPMPREMVQEESDEAVSNANISQSVSSDDLPEQKAMPREDVQPEGSDVAIDEVIHEVEVVANANEPQDLNDNVEEESKAPSGIAQESTRQAILDAIGSINSQGDSPATLAGSAAMDQGSEPAKPKEGVGKATGDASFDSAATAVMAKPAAMPNTKSGIADDPDTPAKGPEWPEVAETKSEEMASEIDEMKPSQTASTQPMSDEMMKPSEEKATAVDASGLFGKLGIRMRGGRDSVTVGELDPNGIAFRSGLRTGDTIVSVSRETVFSTAEFEERLIDAEAGQKLKVFVTRDGAWRTANVMIPE